MKLAELLAQEPVTLNDGDYLASVTRSEGYVPTRKDTTSLHLGQYLYKVVGVGDKDVDGNYAEHNVIPVIKAADGKTFIDDVENPIVIQGTDKVTYMTGRNHPLYKDAYNTHQFHEVTGIEAGTEFRHILFAFLEFVNSEFSMGVNDFKIEGPEYIDSTI
jgi:hypothetical protein